jgi:uncharacterized coiled-coil DUF342 family protein
LYKQQLQPHLLLNSAHLPMQEQCQKLREERESAMRDLARLRCDCESGNAERDRLAAELKEVKDELDK